MRVCDVLDTVAGQIFVLRGDLSSADVHISSGLKPTISDANGSPLHTVEKTALYVRFGSYVVKFHFYVCELLATACLLGGDFFDRFLKAI